MKFVKTLRIHTAVDRIPTQLFFFVVRFRRELYVYLDCMVYERWPQYWPDVRRIQRVQVVPIAKCSDTEFWQVFKLYFALFIIY